MEAAGRYRIHRRIARGGMAEVFEAAVLGASGFERRVALKRMLPTHDADPSFARMFVDEARIASHLHHANIVAVLDYGVLDGRPFQVLELVDGMDLVGLRRFGEERGVPVPEDLALFVCAEIARALDHAHRATDGEGRPLGIVHRDVSPANVLVSWSGDVKLSDFGIAFAHERDEVTHGGVTKGKLSYMSPEQATGGEVDGRTDVFALGCVLHALLAGRSPLTGPDAVRKLILDGELDLDPGLVPDVRAIVSRATRRDREARYRNASDLGDAMLDRLAERRSGDPRRALREWLERVRPAERERDAHTSAGMLDDPVLDVVLDAREGDVQRFHTVAAATTMAAHPQLARVEAPPRRRSRARLGVAALAVAGVAIGAAVISVQLAADDERELPAAVAAAADPTPERPSADVDSMEPSGADRPVAAEPAAHPALGVEPEEPARPRAHARRRRDARGSAAPDMQEAPAPAGAAAPAMAVLAIGGAGAHRAEILIDGTSAGFAPKRLELDVGHHEIVLVTPSGTRITRTVELTARHTRSSPARLVVND